MKPFIWFLIPGFAVLAAWSILFTVDETEYAIVTRFGDPRWTLDKPGLYVKWPYPIDILERFDRRLLVCDMPCAGEPPKEYLTEDKKNIEVASYVCWRIEDPKVFLERIGTRREDAEVRLSSVVLAELGTALGGYELKDLLSTNPEEMKLPQIMREIRETCRHLVTDKDEYDYGIEIVDFRIKRINFPEQNRLSVFKRMRAERKRIATKYRSEGEKEATIIRAEANKQKSLILADAYRQVQETEGLADAEATRIYAEAYGQDPEFYEFLRTLESYEKSFRQGTTIFLPADSPYLKWLRPDVADHPPASDALREPPRPSEESETPDGPSLQEAAHGAKG